MSATAFLLFLVAAGFLALALCGSVLYWYESLNSPEARIPSPKPGLLTCLRQYALSLCSSVLCVALFPLGPLLRRKVKGSAEAQPVVCIHGLNTNAAVWLRLAKRMDEAGYAVSTYSYGSFGVPFERIIAGLDAHIAAVEAAFPGKKPILVCHSLGGLLARHWSGASGNQQRIRGILTLGTPHGGSKLAVFAPGRLARLIVPGSALLTELAQAPPPAVPCTALVSPTDGAVLPIAHLLPPEGWALRITDRASHLGLLFLPSVNKATLEELERMKSAPHESL